MGNCIPNYKIYEHLDGTFGVYAYDIKTYYTFDSEMAYNRGDYTYMWYESHAPVFKDVKNEWYRNTVPHLRMK